MGALEYVSELLKRCTKRWCGRRQSGGGENQRTAMHSVHGRYKELAPRGLQSPASGVATSPAPMPCSFRCSPQPGWCRPFCSRKHWLVIVACLLVSLFCLIYPILSSGLSVIACVLGTAVEADEEMVEFHRSQAASGRNRLSMRIAARISRDSWLCPAES
jgi:hypothetical protein